MHDGESDPHIHVDAKLNADAATRDMIARTFGLVADLSSTVTTGCGLTVPRTMTSRIPNRVTCLPCREHAGRQLLRLADQLEEFGGMPGGIDPDKARAAAGRHRALAREFTSDD